MFLSIVGVLLALTLLTFGILVNSANHANKSGMPVLGVAVIRTSAEERCVVVDSVYPQEWMAWLVWPTVLMPTWDELRFGGDTWAWDHGLTGEIAPGDRFCGFPDGGVWGNWRGRVAFHHGAYQSWGVGEYAD